MSRTVLGAVLGLALGFIHSAHVAADEKVDVSGGWNFEVEIGGMAGTPVFIFKQDGEKLTGQYKGQFGEAELTGKVTGKDIEFAFGPDEQRVTYTGTIKDDGMEGEADYAGQATGNWKGTRINVTGTWNFEVEIGGMKGTPTFTFKQEGEKLTGQYKGQFGEAELTGKVTGDEIEFSFGPEEQKVSYTGTIKKGSMEGEADYAGQATGTWKGTKIDVSGTWNLEIDLGGNSGTPVFVLKQEGDKLTGKYKGQLGEADITGSVNGDEVEFSFEMENNKIVYKGKISSDTMEGEADYGGQASGKWSGKREGTEE
ncbi:MAG: hypothetical protein U1D30_24710 [Planctomycetota bacterium]